MIRTLACTLAALLASLASAQEVKPVPATPLRPAGAEAAKPAQEKPAKVYDEAADAKAQIAAAIKKAGRDHSRVLVVYGGNWCGWCIKLHGLFQSDKDIAKTLLYEYQLVSVDIGKFDKNMDIAAKYEADLKKNGVPFLTVLDGDGKVVTNQDTGSLEAGEKHDAQKVAAFLDKNKAAAVDAEAELKAALSKAASDGKRVFLHFGAPWCGWCHRLEDFMARPEIEKLLAKDFVDVKIDMDRMTNAKEVAQRFRKDEKGGIPWFAFLDHEGKPLATSDGPKTNIGYPAAPEEIAHFVKMLQTTKKNLTDDDIAAIEKALKEAAPK
ncbi:MAG: thioredoxin family protein [Phycisphaerales bacterium]|nr:thioredoxin family protein [Phycisphaerales bacterium]